MTVAPVSLSSSAPLLLLLRANEDRLQSERGPGGRDREVEVGGRPPKIDREKMGTGPEVDGVCVCVWYNNINILVPKEQQKPPYPALLCRGSGGNKKGGSCCCLEEKGC